MSRLVKFREIIDWEVGKPTVYSPAYIDIDKIQYISRHSDGDPKHSTVVLNGSWAVGLDVEMDHLVELVNGTYAEEDTASVLAKTIRSKCKDENEDGSRTVSEVLTDVFKEVNGKDAVDDVLDHIDEKKKAGLSLEDIITYVGPCLRCRTTPWWEWNKSIGLNNAHILSLHCNCAEASGIVVCGEDSDSDSISKAWEIAKQWKTKTSNN